MRSLWFAALVVFCVVASGFILVRGRAGGDAGDVASVLAEQAQQAVQEAAVRIAGEPKPAEPVPEGSPATFFRYTDESGAVRFVTSLEEVPRSLRASARPVGDRVQRAPATPQAQRRQERAYERAYETAVAQRVVVYTTSWCGWCRKTLAFLKQRGVSYENRDIEDHEMWREELIEKTGATSIPVVEIDGEIIRGYDPKRMAQLLGTS